MGRCFWVVEGGCGWFMANRWSEEGHRWSEANRWSKEGDIGGLRKVPVGSLDAMVGMVDLYMRCDAVVIGLMKEINGLKKVSVGYLDAMVGKAEDRVRQSIVKSIMKGKRWFITYFGFITFLCWF